MSKQSLCLRSILIIGIATVTAPNTALVVVAHAGDLNPSSVERIEHRLSNLMRVHGIPGLSVAVATDNELRFTKGFGQADLEHAVPATPDTRYRTASVAKPMTALVVLALMEDGAIDLDVEVQAYCPEFPRKKYPVTTRQLLGHLGGVRHYKNATETRTTEHFFSLKSALGTFADDPLQHQPGTKFLYSTFGYNLLGSVAENAGSQRFPELLREHVFVPAEMSHTVVDDQLTVIPGRARGYIRPAKAQLAALPSDHKLIAGQLYNASLHDTSMKIPGGGLLSTAPDLVRLAIAVNTGKLLKESTLRQMWTSQQTADGQETSYGLGWRVNRRFGRETVWHTGGQAGTSTVLLIVPETGTSVAIMCNLERVALQEVANSIADEVQPPPPPANYAPAIARLESAIRHEVQQKQLPAFSISLVDQDRVVWADGFGFLDAEKKNPATAETVYRVGSVSKLFTDIAVMQLVESGQLDLDVPVQKYLPEFHPFNSSGVPITLRQLMSHRSGLVRESPVGHYFDPGEPTLAQTLASLNETSLVYPPETKTKYSNAAVAVVGAVLERQLEASHPERVRQTIFNPLGMHSSSFVVGPDLESQLATGWMWTYDGRRFKAPTFLLGTGPAGNLYSSVLDLSKFLTCLFREGRIADGRILQPETLRLMMTPIEEAEGKRQEFGLGFHVQSLDGYTKVGHGGAVYGFSTQLEALPERRLGVAAAASLDGSNGVVGRLADYALRLMIATQDGKPLPSYRMTGPIPAERASELIGTYRAVEDQRFARVTELNGHVFLQRGPFRYELRAAADDGTILTDDPIGFGTTVQPQEGELLTIGDTAYRRVPAEPPADIPQRWKDLIGEYGWDHNVLYILEDDGQLYALIEWFYYYPLKEVSENEFAFPDYGLYHGERLKFIRNAQGEATSVTAAEVKFIRREVGTRDGQPYRITPVKPITELRAAALTASPPAEAGDFRKTDLVELTALDPTIKLDIRYATTNNFAGAVFYQQPRAFLQRPAAEAVVRANRRLKEHGLGLLIHDAYRPWHVTKLFWDATPDNLKDFVANPANGSRHNRGCAVDLTLYDLTSDAAIPMVAGYDEFSPRSFPTYPGGTSRQRWYRELLRRTLEAEGFTVYEFEWWHFDYQDWKQYRIGNVSFEKVLETEK